MQQVVTNGTASGSASPLVTGGGQDRNGPAPFNGAETTDDWISPRARSNPTIAVAVVVPYQSVPATGAEVPARS